MIYNHRIDTLSEVQLGVSTFDVCVFVFSQQVCMESGLQYTEDVDVIFSNNNSPLLTSLYKQKLVKPKPQPRTRGLYSALEYARLIFGRLAFSISSYLELPIISKCVLALKYQWLVIVDTNPDPDPNPKP